MKQPIYISGKITGLSRLEVVEKFEAAEQYLRQSGYKNIINPVKLDHSANVNEDYNQYMKTDLKAMMDCTTIYMLPCWKDSNGAKIELQLAVQLNFNIIWAATECEIYNCVDLTTKELNSLSYQSKVQIWIIKCFGVEVALNKTERNHRFIEETLELVQSLGCTKEDVLMLVNYVFNRPLGAPMQEVGGVMVTLAALCAANGLPMEAAGDVELARVWTKIDAIRLKQATKPHASPLPQ